MSGGVKRRGGGRWSSSFLSEFPTSYCHFQHYLYLPRRRAASWEGCTRTDRGWPSMPMMPMMPMPHAHAHADAHARTRASTGAMPRAPRAYTATRPLAALRCSVSDDSRRPGTPSLAASASSRFRRTTARVLSPRLAELRHSAYSASAASASPGQGSGSG